MNYKVCKDGIFKSIQGEGHHAGRCAVFVRLAGCNKKPRCSFCDEKFDDYRTLSAEEIVKEVKAFEPFAMVVITGGEPTMQPLEELVNELHKEQYYIAMETNGLNECTAPIDWITCSPKSEEVHLSRANELKYVVGDTKENVLEFINKTSEKIKHDHIFLQPRSNEQEMIDLSVELIHENKAFELSLQIHKIINVK